MKASTVFIVSAIVALIFGLAFVLFPQQTTALYGVDLTEGGIFIGRLLGAALLTFFVMGWMVRNAAPSPERRAPDPISPETGALRAALCAGQFPGKSFSFMIAGRSSMYGATSTVALSVAVTTSLGPGL